MRGLVTTLRLLLSSHPPDDLSFPFDARADLSEQITRVSFGNRSIDPRQRVGASSGDYQSRCFLFSHLLFPVCCLYLPSRSGMRISVTGTIHVHPAVTSAARVVGCLRSPVHSYLQGPSVPYPLLTALVCLYPPRRPHTNTTIYLPPQQPEIAIGPAKVSPAVEDTGDQRNSALVVVYPRLDRCRFGKLVGIFE